MAVTDRDAAHGLVEERHHERRAVAPARLDHDVKPLEVKSDGGVLVLSVADDGLGIYVAVNVGVLRVSRFIPASTARRVWAWLGDVLGHPEVPV